MKMISSADCLDSSASISLAISIPGSLQSTQRVQCEPKHYSSIVTRKSAVSQLLQVVQNSVDCSVNNGIQHLL